MSAKKAACHARRRKRIEGALRIRERDFPFVIHRQAEKLGPDGDITYWYMQPTGLRNLGNNESIENFRSCIGYWFAGAQEAGRGEDIDELRTFVLATSYGILCHHKGVQRVYRDSFLKPGSVDPSEFPPSPDDLQRIHTVVASRDQMRLKQELDAVLESQMPSMIEMELFAKAFFQWIDAGVNALLRRGADGLADWLTELETWVGKYTKNSKTRPLVRAFVNFYAYRAKISFYLCYASFWASLIPWLKQYHELNDVSARFLRVWHNQNPPIRIPAGRNAGRTAGGVIDPTHGRAQLLLSRDNSGPAAPREISCETPRLAPECQFDVFSGQVLALHPLTWFMFSDQEACQLAGRIFRLPDFDTIMPSGNAGNYAEYWELAQAILLAAYNYRNAHNAFENSRHMKKAGGDSTLSVARDDAPPPIDTVLRDYVDSERLLCECGTKLDYAGLKPGMLDQGVRQTFLKCSKCSATSTIVITADDFKLFLKPPD